MDINGDNYAELIVPYGKRLWAFDGEDGTSSEVSDGWSSHLVCQTESGLHLLSLIWIMMAH